MRYALFTLVVGRRAETWRFDGFTNNPAYVQDFVAGALTQAGTPPPVGMRTADFKVVPLDQSSDTTCNCRTT